MQSENICPGWYSGDNKRLFELFSIFLNLKPDYVTAGMIAEIAGEHPSDRDAEFAEASIIAAACGLDVYGSAGDRRFFSERFLPCFRLLDTSDYTSDPYYRNIHLENITGSGWSFEQRECAPFEAFVYDDPEIRKCENGFTVSPKIGFFREAYPYPAVLENGREWMTLMPNEINTSRLAVERSHGRVLTFGLGLGYFAYMAASKPNVTSVTVAEFSDGVISLFEKYIRPQIEFADKIKIVKADCISFAENTMKTGEYNFVFADIWHDPSDGIGPYLKLKELEPRFPGTEFVYWVEKTLKLYL